MNINKWLTAADGGASSSSLYRSFAPLSLTLVLGALLSAGVGAEEQPAGEHEADKSHESHNSHESSEPHSTVGIFIGDTNEDRRNGFTVGLEYEYRVSQLLGLGITAEHVAGEFDTNVFVAPIALHSGPWKVYAGPGIEDGEEGSEFLMRVGLEYGFHFGEYEISPQVDVDFVDGEQLFVLGVVFGMEL